MIAFELTCSCFSLKQITFLETTVKLDELVAGSFAFTFLSTAFSFNPPKMKFMNYFTWNRAAVVYDFLTDEGANVKVSILSIYRTGQNDNNSLSHIRNWKDKIRAKYMIPIHEPDFSDWKLLLYALVQMDVCLFPNKEVSLSLYLCYDWRCKWTRVKRVLCSDWPIAGQICSVCKAGNRTRSLSVLMDLDFAPSILFTS